MMFSRTGNFRPRSMSRTRGCPPSRRFVIHGVVDLRLSAAAQCNSVHPFPSAVFDEKSRPNFPAGSFARDERNNATRSGSSLLAARSTAVLPLGPSPGTGPSLFARTQR